MNNSARSLFPLRFLARLARPAVRLLLPAVLCIAAFSALPARAAESERVRVVYGFDREFPPFSYEEAGGKPIGFEVELMEAVFKDSRATLIPRAMRWDLIPLDLSSGAITLTTGMVRTEQRSMLYLFSEKPTFPLQIRLFTKVYNRWPSARFLRGQAVSVERTSYAQFLLESYGGMNIKTFPDRVGGLRALYNDEVAAYCGPVQNTYYYINKLNYGAITTVGTPLGITEMRVAVNRERGDVQRMVDEGLERVIQSGEYDRLYRKWFVRELTPQEQELMLKAALEASLPAYVPYGGRGQGAAILTATGKVYTGCTVENADLSMSMSALKAAVARAVREGEFEFRAAVIVDQNGKVIAPGGEETQVLYEFGRGILAIVDSGKGKYETRMMSEMLPSPVVRQTSAVKVE